MFLAFRLKFIFTVNLTTISLINKNHVNIKTPKKVQYQSIQFGGGELFVLKTSHLKDQLVEGYWVDSSSFFLTSLWQHASLFVSLFSTPSIWLHQKQYTL